MNFHAKCVTEILEPQFFLIYILPTRENLQITIHIERRISSLLQIASSM